MKSKQYQLPECQALANVYSFVWKPGKPVGFFKEQSIWNSSHEMRDSRDEVRVAESTIVVMKAGNAAGAKGWQIERA